MIKAMICALVLVSVMIPTPTPVPDSNSRIIENKKHWIMENKVRELNGELRIDFPLYMQCDLSEEDFEFFARVVAAEVDTEHYDGCVAVACVVWNRTENSQFKNTVRGVLTESGQFSTVRNGKCSKETGDVCRRAIVDAYNNRPLPYDVVFFRSGYYFKGYERYKRIDGNYFSYQN